MSLKMDHFNIESSTACGKILKIELNSTLVIRQKEKSQIRCFKKIKHTKFSEKRTFT